jgi:hypothetical protein
MAIPDGIALLDGISLSKIESSSIFSPRFRYVTTLPVTPAMAVGISDHVWEIGEIVNFTEC